MPDLVTATIVQSCRIDSETYLSGQDAVLGDNAQVINQDFAIGSTDALAILGFDKDNLAAIYLLADEDITVTFTLGTGTLAVDLKADIPWVWTKTYAGEGLANPFGYDVVSAAVSGGAAATNIKGRILTTI